VNRSGLSTFFLAFFSAIIGALIMLFGLYAALNLGYLELPGISVNQPSDADNDQDSGSKLEVIEINSAIIEAVKKVKPAVVGVINIQERSDFWSSLTQDVDVGEGSGFVFKVEAGKGYVLTNYHVIEKAKEIEVILSSGERVAGKLIGSDLLTDLAVLEIDAKYVEGIAELGESTNLQIGEAAIAIGNPLGHEFSQTVTVGVISSDNRILKLDTNNDGRIDWDSSVIQTDAAINRGNSGGPLVNIAGQVIGINNAKIDDSKVEGIGFAIPISDAKPIIEQLLDKGVVVRPFMGVNLYDVKDLSVSNRNNVVKLPEGVKEGVVITEIVTGGAAEKAGLERLDTIVKLDDTAIANSNDLRKYLYTQKKVGEQLKVTYYREGKIEITSLVLEGNEG
jgi:serine protease Do